MTKTEINARVTELNDGLEISSTLFDMFLDTAQMYWENRRPWVYLRAEDTSQTVSPGNTFQTQKTLPADFRKWYTRFPIVLTDAQYNPQQFLAEVPMNMKTAYKDDNSRFYADYAAGKVYLCGAPAQTFTVRQNYIKKATLVSADDDNEWIFPSEYHAILPLSIAVYHKLGVDYDIINNSQATQNAALAKSIFESMTEWDGELAESALQGQDYTRMPGGYFGGDGMSGNASFLL